MADQELWRKNIPEDFQGKMGEHWDDEISMGPIYWSAVAIAGSVAFAFVLCWFMMGAPLDYYPDKFWGTKAKFSPLDEANARRLPPTPWLQPKPEVEMDDLLKEMAEHNSSYGWNDQLNGIVRIPVDRAMDLVAESMGSTPASVEPVVDTPLDVEPGIESSDEAPAVEPEDGAHGVESGDDHNTAAGEAHG